MVEEKGFTIFSNLAVTDGSTSKLDNQDVIGLIYYSPSDDKFFPSYFSSYQKPECVILRRYNIDEESIKLNRYFKIVSITEKRDPNRNRSYYIKLIIEVEDLLGNKKEFPFYEKPEIHITNLDLQRMIREIYIKLELEKSFEIIDLNETLISERKICEDQQQKILELEKTVISLQDRLKKSN